MSVSAGVPGQPRAVLFDLDGTLVDSAPDLAGAANDMRVARGLAPLPYAPLRAMVGSGARGLVGVAFDVAPGHADFEPLKEEFLDRYARRLLQETRVFEAMRFVIDHLDARTIPWGVVTNKHTRFAEPVVQGLGLHARSAVLVCGDTTPHAKPHPEPLLEAARRLKVPAEGCVYVGDDRRDIEAGRAAGMRSAAAGWGYLGVGEPIHAWGAEAVLQHPAELLRWLGLETAAGGLN